MTESINAIMLMLIVALACAAVIVRLTPALMRKLADWLNARADAECWFAIQHEVYKRHRAEREGSR